MSDKMEESLRAFLERKEKLDEAEYETETGYTTDFWELRNKMMQFRDDEKYPTTEGQKSCNGTKNRYKDILPYDHTRVVLTQKDGVEGSDYINANFITGAAGRRTYIASQGPKPNTVNSFWQMLWENKTQIIIMACNEHELGKHKCERYWATKGEELEFAGIKVKLIEEKSTYHKDYIVRRLQACKGSEKRGLFQFHYVAWPDHGTPTSALPILDMMALARQFQSRDFPPIVVHCSAGCGRTGTIIVIDYTWSTLKQGRLMPDYSIYNLIDTMRTERISLVQSLDQYIFVFNAVAELFQRHLTILDEHCYANVNLQDQSSTEFRDYYNLGEDGQTGEEEGEEGGEDIDIIYESIYGNIDPDNLPPETPTEQVIMRTFFGPSSPRTTKTSAPNARPRPLAMVNGTAESSSIKAAANKSDKTPPALSQKPPVPTKPESSPNGSAAGTLTPQSKDKEPRSPRPVPPKRPQEKTPDKYPQESWSELGHTYSEVQEPVDKAASLATFANSVASNSTSKSANQGLGQGSRQPGPGGNERPQETVYEAVEEKCDYEPVAYSGDYKQDQKSQPLPGYTRLIRDNSNEDESVPALPHKTAGAYECVESMSRLQEPTPNIPKNREAIRNKPSPPKDHPNVLLTSGTISLGPRKGGKLKEMFNFGSQPVVSSRKYSGEAADVIYKEIHIGFPHRVGQPKGDRKQIFR